MHHPGEDITMDERKRRFRVWHAVAIFLAANFISGLPARYVRFDVFYDNFAQPDIAPPAWLFVPMWLFLNIASLVALYRIANSERSPERRIVLISEAFAWVLFASHTALFFGLQSTILGAVNVVTMLLCTAVSVVYAGKVDKLSSALLIPRLLWLLLASYVGVWMAVVNADRFFQG